MQNWKKTHRRYHDDDDDDDRSNVYNIIKLNDSDFLAPPPQTRPDKKRLKTWVIPRGLQDNVQEIKKPPAYKKRRKKKAI